MSKVRTWCAREAEPARLRSHGAVPLGPALAWSGAVHNVQTFAAAVARAAVLTLAGEPVSADNPDHVTLRFGGPVPTAREVRIPRNPRCPHCAGVR